MVSLADSQLHWLCAHVACVKVDHGKHDVRGGGVGGYEQQDILSLEPT